VIALYKGRSRFSRIIRLITRGPYSHAAWICRDGSVIEAWSGWGVRHVAHLGALHQVGTQVDIYDIPSLSHDQQTRIETWLITQLGKPYDWPAVLRFLPLPWRNRDRESSASQGSWFCSELVAAACEAAGLRLLAVHPYMISPSMLAASPLLRLACSRVTDDAPPEEPVRHVIPRVG